MGNKRHLLQNLIETDSCLSIGNKMYHFECESNPGSGIVAIRMFQYDVTVALENKKQEKGCAEGHAKGCAEMRQENYRKLVDKIQNKIAKGKSAAQAAEELEEDISVIQPIYDEILRKNKAE